MKGPARFDEVDRRYRVRVLYAWLPVLMLVAAAFGVSLALETAARDRAAPPVERLDPTPLAAEPAGAPPERPLLRVAVAPVVSPQRTLRQYRDLVGVLADAVGRDGLLMQRASYSDVNAMLRDGRCDVAFVCTYAFVRGERGFGLEPLAVPRIDGRITYRSIVVVPRGSTAESLLDLEGARFASTDPLSNTGWLYPASVLRRAGRDPGRFFSEIIYTGGHDRAVDAVATGLADAAAVDEIIFRDLVEEDPGLEARLEVIHASPRFGMPPVVASPHVEPELRRHLQQALWSLHETPRGRAALDKLDIERFEPVRPSDYDAVRAMATEQRSRP